MSYARFALAVLAAAALRGEIALERLETVAREVSTGDGGNSWGAHKLRIVRTRDGVFTSYATGAGYLDRGFRLAQRTESGWATILKGPGGREPANLASAPDGSLRVIAWPGGLPVLHTIGPAAHGARAAAEQIPGNWKKNDWPYHAAAAGDGGELFVLVSYGEKPGEFRWARRTAAGEWSFHTAEADFRHCYAFLFAHGGGLDWLAAKDVLWESAGWQPPPGVFRYAFNGLKLWRWDADTRATALREEPQTPEFLNVRCFHSDAYRDTRGRLHVLYNLQGPSTGGRSTAWHMIVDSSGAVLKDVQLPRPSSWRILEDAHGAFYLFAAAGSKLQVYGSSSDDGTELEAPREFDLGASVDSHVFLATPRAGVPLADYADGAFLSTAGDWIYFRVRLR